MKRNEKGGKVMCDFCKSTNHAPNLINTRVESTFVNRWFTVWFDGKCNINLTSDNKETGIIDLGTRKIHYCPMCGRKLKSDYE